LLELLNTHRDFFDFVYIDGDHHGYAMLQDVVMSWKLLKCGGIILLDDYGMTFKDPRMVSPKTTIDAFLEIYRNHYELIIKNYQVAIKKIKNYMPLEYTPGLCKKLQES
jgi:predicted O-methyltransferase YrrM